MKKFFAAALLFTVVLLLSGCAGQRLTDGFYQTADGAPYYAAVYQDQIFLQLERPRLFSGTNSLWVWAGSYSLREDNEIELDLSDKLRRDWEYSYTLQASDGGIRVTPLDDPRTAFWLRLNKNPQRVYQNMNH